MDLNNYDIPQNLMEEDNYISNIPFDENNSFNIQQSNMEELYVGDTNTNQMVEEVINMADCVNYNVPLAPIVLSSKSLSSSTPYLNTNWDSILPYDKTKFIHSTAEYPPSVLNRYEFIANQVNEN
ncbi:hypothetical protein QTN25_005780 [Entamoeba marina]